MFRAHLNDADRRARFDIAQRLLHTDDNKWQTIVWCQFQHFRYLFCIFVLIAYIALLKTNCIYR